MPEAIIVLHTLLSRLYESASFTVWLWYAYCSSDSHMSAGSSSKADLLQPADASLRSSFELVLLSSILLLIHARSGGNLCVR